MKRSSMPPRTKPLPRGTKRLRAKGRSKFPARRCPEYMDWLREKLWLSDELVLCDSECGRVATDRAHLKPKGGGGDDLNNVVLLCRWCHREQEKRTAAWAAEVGIDIWAKAREHTEAWERENGKRRDT